MAIAVTNIGTAANTSGSTTSISIGADGVPAGATVFVATTENCGLSSNPTSPGTVTDSASNSYSAAASQASGNQLITAIFYAYNISALSSGNSITYAKVHNTQVAMSAFYATGLTSTDPIDSAATNTAQISGSTSGSVTSGTPGTSGDLFVSVLGKFSHAESFTEPSGWSSPFVGTSTGSSGQNILLYGGNLVATDTSTQTFSLSWTTSGSAGMVIAAFKAASGSAVSLSGTSSSTSTFSGSESVSRSVQASSASTSTFSASAKVQRSIAASSSSTSTFGGTLGNILALRGTSSSESTLSGNFLTIILLAGTSQSQSTAFASVSRAAGLGALLESLSTFSGALHRGVSVSGLSSSSSTQSSKLSRAVKYTGTSSSISSFSATFTTKVYISATCISVSAITGSLSVSRSLTGDSESISAMGGRLAGSAQPVNARSAALIVN